MATVSGAEVILNDSEVAKAQESIQKKMFDNTFKMKWMAWTLALRDNMQKVLASPDILSLPKIPPTVPMLCLGAGPSLADHLDELKKFKGVVIACERRLVEILKAERVPEYVVNIDCDPIYEKFVDDPVVTEHAAAMTGVFAVTGSPALIKKWPGTAVFFVKHVDEICDDKQEIIPGSLTAAFIALTGKTLVNTGTNAGMFAWILSRLLGATKTVLLGYDYAYRKDDSMENSQLWPLLKQLKPKDRLNWFCNERSAFGKEVVTDLAWGSNAKTFLAAMATDFGETIQCSDYTILHGIPKIKCMTFAEYLESQS